MTKIESSKNSLKISEDTKQDSSNDGINKKKKRKKKATICTTYCKFEIVRRTARNQGMKEVPYTEQWNVLWTDYSVSIAKIKVLKGYQRVNHFPGMAEICHKALLAKNLNRMAKIFPKQYNFFPKTWCFPSEYNDAVEYSKKHIGRTYILKPGAGCRGQGIQLTKNFRCLPPADKLICQLYLSKPFLVDGLKFDLRVYTLVTSCDPLRIYVYNEGLARFATAPYRKPAGYNLANCYMHLTNYSVNKYSSTYVSDGECGTKRRISCLNQWLSRNLYDVEDIWYKIDDVIAKTIISALPVIRHSYQVSFPNHDVLPACFEILGFDILLDSNLNPFVLEVNHSPSFNTDSKVDEEIKVALLEDTFKLLNLADMDTQKILEQDKKRSLMRLQHGIDPQDLDDRFSSDNSWYYEEGYRGNYRLIYPVKGKPTGTKEDPYKPFMDQASNFSLMVSDNNASKAREQVSKINREQLSQKDQLEQLLKVHNNNSKQQVQQQLYKLPEITLKNMKSESKVQKKEPSKPKLNETEASSKKVTVVEKEPKTEIKSIPKEEKNEKNEENVNVAKDQKLKVESKTEVIVNDKEIKKIKDLRSEINLVILEGEEQGRIVRNNHQGSEYFVNKLYKRLKESDHMPGAFPSKETSKVVTPEEVTKSAPTILISKEKTTTEKISHGRKNRKQKHSEDPEVIGMSKKGEPRKREESFLRRIPTKDFALIFHSRAASEFLKFQKMKLLKKFHDLI